MKSSVKKIRLHNNLTLRLLGEESVLFLGKSRQLFGLDLTATVALLRLDDGESSAAVAADLGLSPQEVGRIESLLAGEESQSIGEYENELICPVMPADFRSTAPSTASYQLLRTVFTIDAPPEILKELITPAFAALPAAEDCIPELVISIDAATNGWQISLNGAPQGEAVMANRLLPRLYGLLRVYTITKQPQLLTMHGSVVRGDDGSTIILAGSSGAGKSTLAAALLARGFSLVSDEPVIIAADGKSIYPLPLPLGVKEGSWLALSPDYPEIDSLLNYERFDGQKICYLQPDSIRISSALLPCRKACLIFPEYSAEGFAESSSLSPVQTMQRILKCGYHLPDLDEVRVDAIIQWLLGIDRYSLAYSSTDEALSLLTKIVEINWSASD